MCVYHIQSSYHIESKQSKYKSNKEIKLILTIELEF